MSNFDHFIGTRAVTASQAFDADALSDSCKCISTALPAR